MQFFKRLGRYAPLLVGVLILVIIIVLAPWEEISDLLAKIHKGVFVVLFALSLTYFVSKAFRFWYILSILDIQASPRAVALLYFAGQPFSMLPAGELYRTVLLEKHLDVPRSKSAPSVTIQGLVEAIVLLAFSLVGAFAIGKNRVAVGIVGLLLLALIIALQRGWFLKAHPLVNKVPFVTVNETKFRRFVKGHQKLLQPRTLAILITLSLIPVLAGVGILFASGYGIGVHLSFFQAVIGYSLPVIISGLSFLPGGLGVGEGGTIGLLHLFGVTTAAAITMTLLVRIFTLVAGIIYGLVAQIALHLRTRTS